MEITKSTKKENDVTTKMPKHRNNISLAVLGALGGLGALCDGRCVGRI
jgi:hypothetical protein